MKKILYISVILNVLALLMIGRGVSALSVSKEVQDLVGYIQSIIFTDDGTPSGNIKVRISGGEGMIYGSGGIWIGKGGGNGIYSNGTNVGIGTTDLSNRLNIGGDVGVKNESKLKMGLNGNSYVQGTGNIMNIISQGVVNMEGVRNYIRGGVVTFGSTWYDENDSSYYMDLNNNSKLSNLNTKGVVTINTVGNAELDLKSGNLGHWGIYHDGVSEELRMWNGGLNRLSIGKGGEIYTNNGILVDGSKNWKGNILQSDVGGTNVGGCLSGETIIWSGGNWVCGMPIQPILNYFAGAGTEADPYRLVGESASVNTLKATSCQYYNLNATTLTDGTTRGTGTCGGGTKSCLSDGVYRIDPDASGSYLATNVYCDMTTDGGGWTYLLNPGSFSLSTSLGLSFTSTANGSSCSSNPVTLANVGNFYMAYIYRCAWNSTTITMSWVNILGATQIRLAAYAVGDGPAIKLNGTSIINSALTVGKNYHAGSSVTCTNSPCLWGDANYYSTIKPKIYSISGNVTGYTAGTGDGNRRGGGGDFINVSVR